MNLSALATELAKPEYAGLATRSSGRDQRKDDHASPVGSDLASETIRNRARHLVEDSVDSRGQ
jgi:hypothetical protein